MTLHFLPTLPLALDLAVSLAFVLAKPDISNSAPVDHKNDAGNMQHVRIKSEVNLFPNFIHSCNGTCQSTNIQNSVTSGFL